MSKEIDQFDPSAAVNYWNLKSQHVRRPNATGEFAKLPRVSESEKVNLCEIKNNVNRKAESVSESDVIRVVESVSQNDVNRVVQDVTESEHSRQSEYDSEVDTCSDEECDSGNDESENEVFERLLEMEIEMETI